MLKKDWQRLVLRLLGFLLSVTLAGCALPAAGPTSTELESSADQNDFNFNIVKIDGRVAAILNRYSAPTLGDRFTGTRYVSGNTVEPGDVISLTIYESGGNSLFGAPVSSPAMQPGASMPSPSASAGTSTIPSQVVEADGTILVPFAGRVKVSGKTPAQIGELIEKNLQGMAVSPQVIVSAVGNFSQTATVGGDVQQPRPVSLSLRGERLLDVIANAGGSKYPPYETIVRVVRRNTVGQVLLQTIVNNPNENIVIRPRDQIFLTHQTRTFAVLGATQKVSQYTFDAEKVSLAEAIARAGGPIDAVGDPTGIYLFRFEPLPVVREILNQPELGAGNGPPPKGYPILYRVGMTNAEGIFVAQSIQIRDKDVILVTNAEATQLQKLLVIARGITGIAFDLSRPLR